MTGTKQHLLSWLKQNARQWVSGEQISNRLGISRTAVWKQINNLKAEGHRIESAPKKGYRLKAAADLLTAQEIQPLLNTRTMGRPDIVFFKETDSTNLQAKHLALQGAPEGTLVVADAQTQGRGRRGRQWFSPAGRSIYASLILRPPLGPAQAPQLTLMTAVAVAGTLQKAGLQARIKWPNDILIDGRKIAGILTELSTEMDQVDWVVVGMGINVNTPAAQMPPEIREIATSVLIHKGREHSRAQLLCALLENFENTYEQLKTQGFGPIMKQWRQMTDIIGQSVTVDLMNTRLEGTVTTVDDDGVLMLRDDRGQIHRIISGDVTRMRSLPG